jgi:hypothetical protein
LLHAKIEILNVEPLSFRSARARIISSSGLFRKKNVPWRCFRGERSLTSECKKDPYMHMGRVARIETGTRCQAHSFASMKGLAISLLKASTFEDLVNVDLSIKAIVTGGTTLRRPNFCSSLAHAV